MYQVSLISSNNVRLLTHVTCQGTNVGGYEQIWHLYTFRRMDPKALETDSIKYQHFRSLPNCSSE